MEDAQQQAGDILSLASSVTQLDQVGFEPDEIWRLVNISYELSLCNSDEAKADAVVAEAKAIAAKHKLTAWQVNYRSPLVIGNCKGPEDNIKIFVYPWPKV